MKLWDTNFFAFQSCSEIEWYSWKRFGAACEKIEKYQKKYKSDYDKRHKVKEFKMKVGEKVQYKRTRTSKAKGGKNEIKWLPRNSFYTLRKINKQHKTVLLFNPHTGRPLNKTHPFDRIRKFKA